MKRADEEDYADFEAEFSAPTSLFELTKIT